MNQKKIAQWCSENFDSEKYQIISELGKHPQVIYINYLGKNKFTNESVIITHYFLPEAIFVLHSKSNYQEIFELLQSLEHCGIPRYLDYFETEKGFCLVQEYKENLILIKNRELTLEEIKQVAISTLEILIYLQEQNPPIFYHQISPDTLLIDNNLQVYFTAFGLASMGEMNSDISPLLKKNQSLIPPEYKRGKSLTKNSDLYSLGVTLLCLQTGNNTNKINNLIGQDGSFNVQGLISQEISFTWIEWLENLMAVNPKDRYDDAISALNALRNIEMIRLPDVQFIPDILELKSDNYGEIISKNINIINPIIDTNLVGKWKVKESKYDGQIKDFHPWISFEPYQFESNKIVCKLNINTGKLKAGKTYQRKLILETNSAQKQHLLPLKITTAKITIKNLFYPSLIILLMVALGCGWLSGFIVKMTPNLINWLIFILGLFIGSMGGYGASFSKINWFVKAVTIIGSLSVTIGLFTLGSDVDLIIGFFVGLIVVSTAGMMIKFYLDKKCAAKIAITLAILASCFGVSFGINLSLHNSNYSLLFLILLTGFPLIWMLFNPYLKYQKQINSYRQKEAYLIKS